MPSAAWGGVDEPRGTGQVIDRTPPVMIPAGRCGDHLPMRAAAERCTLDVEPGRIDMSVWNNRGFTENELSRPAKLLAGAFFGALLLVGVIAATTNAIHGVVPRPWCISFIALGFLLFLIPKMQVVRHKSRISFGSALMTTGQANSYRLGYLLMAGGYLLTFW